MKAILLFLLTLPLACSSEDLPETEELQETHKIFVMDACPDFDTNNGYWVTKDVFNEVMDHVSAQDEYCVAIQFEDLRGLDREGYYGGQLIKED